MRKILATVLLLASFAGAQLNRLDVNAQIKAAPLTDTGAANAYVVSMSMMGTSYYTGMPVVFKAANTNSGSSTINVNAIGVKTIKKTDGATNLAAGDLQAGAVYLLVYDGTNFQLLAPAPGASSLAAIIADAVLQNATGSSAAPTGVAIPTCSSDGGHALVYSTSSHTWTCATLSGGAGAATRPYVSKAASYTITTSDFSALDFFVFTCSSSCDATLPATAPGTTGQFVTIKNNGTGSLFVMHNGLAIDGNAAPLLVPSGYSVEIVTDASNYFSENMTSHSQFAARRRSQIVAHASSNIIVVGTAVTVTTGGALTSNAATSTEGEFINDATAASSNSCVAQTEVGGMWGIASTASNPRWSGRFGMDDGSAGVTNTRVFFGFMDTVGTVAAFCGALATDTPNVNFIMFRCSSAVPDSNWIAIVGKGASGGTQTASTGVACNTTNHTFAIQEHGGATAYFYVDGVFKVCIGSDTGCTSASGHYPAFAAARMFVGLQTTNTVARNLHYFWMEAESDH